MRANMRSRPHLPPHHHAGEHPARDLIVIFSSGIAAKEPKPLSEGIAFPPLRASDIAPVRSSAVPLDMRKLRRLTRFCGFLDVPPPDSGKSCLAVFRHQIGSAEAIPSCGAHFGIVPLRNEVVIPQQNAVECSRSRLEIGAVLGEDNLIDHGVDRWVFDANHVG